jgi:hypothetical protein
MAALDVWRMALDQSQGRRVDIASFLKGHSVEEFLPASVIASVKTPTKWLEFVCNQIPDRIFGGIERATRDKCVQCYVKTYEEMVSPDVYKFFVKDDDKDTMEVEVSAHRGIKCRSSNEQVTICQLYSVLHIEAITSHSMVKLTYKDQEQKNNFLSVSTTPCSSTAALILLQHAVCSLARLVLCGYCKSINLPQHFMFLELGYCSFSVDHVLFTLIQSCLTCIIGTPHIPRCKSALNVIIPFFC